MEKTRKKLFFALGTVNSVSVPCDAGDTALRLAEERVMELDDRLSVFKAGSEISRVNAAAGDRFVKVRPDTLFLLKHSVSFSWLTGGPSTLPRALWLRFGALGRRMRFRILRK